MTSTAASSSSRDERTTLTEGIRPLFREKDCQLDSMALDLACYGDVRANDDVAKLSDGPVPRDGPNTARPLEAIV
jgi:hypothetical protein